MKTTRSTLSAVACALLLSSLLAAQDPPPAQDPAAAPPAGTAPVPPPASVPLDQAAAPAVPPQDVEAVHGQLRALRRGLTESINANDIEAVLSYLHPNVVITWQNGEVSRGHDGVRKYYQRMMNGPDRVVERFSINPEADELTILYPAGGAATAGVVWGRSTDTFELTDGMDFTLNGRWSATLVEEGGRWLIANAHASTNVFDNAVLAEVKRQVGLWAGLGGLAAGLLLGLLLAIFFRRERKPAREVTPPAAPPPMR